MCFERFILMKRLGTFLGSCWSWARLRLRYMWKPFVIKLFTLFLYKTTYLMKQKHFAKHVVSSGVGFLISICVKGGSCPFAGCLRWTLRLSNDNNHSCLLLPGRVATVQGSQYLSAAEVAICGTNCVETTLCHRKMQKAKVVESSGLVLDSAVLTTC